MPSLSPIGWINLFVVASTSALAYKASIQVTLFALHTVSDGSSCLAIKRSYSLVELPFLNHHHSPFFSTESSRALRTSSLDFARHYHHSFVQDGRCSWRSSAPYFQACACWRWWNWKGTLALLGASTPAMDKDRLRLDG